MTNDNIFKQLREAQEALSPFLKYLEASPEIQRLKVFQASPEIQQLRNLVVQAEQALKPIRELHQFNFNAMQEAVRQINNLDKMINTLSPGLPAMIFPANSYLGLKKAVKEVMQEIREEEEKLRKEDIEELNKNKIEGFGS